MKVFVSFKKCLKDVDIKNKVKFTLLLLLIFSSVSSTIYSQSFSVNDNEDNHVFYLEELSANKSLRSSSSSLPNYIKPEIITSLISDLRPSVFMNNGSYEINGEKPVRAYVDLNSLQRPIARQPIFDNVEIVVINMENPTRLNSNINLNNLSGFTKLKYIYVVCGFDCERPQIMSTFSKSEKDYIIIYSIQKQS